MIKQIAHICILTTDLKETLSFYTNLLKLKIKFRFIRQGKVFGYYLSSGKNTFFEIFKTDDKKNCCQGGITHLCFEVADIKKVTKHLDNKKIKHSEPKLAIDNTWQIWIEDPNGVKIEFHQYTRTSCQFTGKDCIFK